MKAPGILKTILLLFLANYLESITAPAFIKIYVALPLTFLVFSGLVYKSSKNINPIYAFCLGIFVDLISNSLFGLNAMLFCLFSLSNTPVAHGKLALPKPSKRSC